MEYDLLILQWKRKTLTLKLKERWDDTKRGMWKNIELKRYDLYMLSHNKQLGFYAKLRLVYTNIYIYNNSLI